MHPCPYVYNQHFAPSRPPRSPSATTDQSTPGTQVSRGAITSSLLFDADLIFICFIRSATKQRVLALRSAAIVSRSQCCIAPASSPSPHSYPLAMELIFEIG